MAFIMTRINVPDYDTWRKMFDQDAPGGRTGSKGTRVFRNADQPNEVFIQVEFANVADAKAARERLLASGVLDRFPDKNGPTVVEEAGAAKN
jgi:hypothetical protein